MLPVYCQIYNLYMVIIGGFDGEILARGETQGRNPGEKFWLRIETLEWSHKKDN